MVDPSEIPDYHSEENCSATVQVSTIVTKGPSMSTLSKTQKYKKALGLGQKLAALTSECGMTEFKRKISILETLFVMGKKLYCRNSPTSRGRVAGFYLSSKQL